MIVTGDNRCPPQISHGLTWYRARASAARLSHGTALKFIYSIHLQKIFISELTQSSVCFNSKDQSEKAVAGNNRHSLSESQNA